MPIFNAEDSTRSSLDRVRSSTASHVNEEIDHQTDINSFFCSMDYKDGVLPYPYCVGLVSVPGEKSTGKNTRSNSGWRKAELIQCQSYLKNIQPIC